MAQKVVWIDDLDPDKEAEETVIFGVDGVSYEIDLCRENADKLRVCLEPFATAGRRAGSAPRQTPAPAAPPRVIAAASNKREQLDAIREWAKKKGFQVADRGRIPVTVQQAFEKAHQGGRASAV